MTASDTMAGHHHMGTSVADLTGPGDRTPDVRVTLTAAHSKIKLASGREIDALTFNGQAPGPQIRAKKGQLLEVTLLNTDVKEGVTLHWHGVDVPNAEDGVPGVTQEAVMPGQKHVYRFVPNCTGTFWYHTHRASSLTVVLRRAAPELPTTDASAGQGGNNVHGGSDGELCLAIRTVTPASELLGLTAADVTGRGPDLCPVQGSWA
ncbi:multicopper oxidase domain-containing protein [Nonomuraea rhodomycinica]|uniref:multicopper oxidase domain-containing protein n=1 Tax=Nonomuraea rhodomycinica TaxID=1712872 RepID=UPI001C376DFD|nr:multicopper oxidase domain-containing protein [Nonomuraea rhodomycinica]